MKAYCDNCRTKQSGNERNCLSCGTSYSSSKWWILVGILMVAVPAGVFISDGRLEEILDVRILLWYVAPITLLIALLCDYHPIRRALYFWVGGAVIALSVLILQSIG